MIATLPSSPAGDAEIYSSVAFYYELQKVPPRLEALKQKLRATPHDPELQQTEEVGFSLDELLTFVQASKGELFEALAQERAFEMNGRWRVLSERYERELFTLILLNLQSDVLEPVYLRATYRSIQSDMQEDAPPLRIVRHLLTVYSIEVTKEDADEVYRLDADLVMQFYAEGIFLSHKRAPVPLEEFMNRWNAECPADCRPQRSLLNGMAVETAKGSARYMTYFPARDLPQDIPARFAALFGFQAQWKLADLQPYLRAVAHSMTVDQLLFKYCRSTQTPEGKVYTKR